MAELRQNPTAALDEVQAGEVYVITRHRHPIARLVPMEATASTVIPAKAPGGSQLSKRPRRKTYAEAEARLRDLEEQW